jgi:hypothetical protein
MRDRVPHRRTSTALVEQPRFGAQPNIAERIEKLEAAVPRKVDEIDLTKRDERLLLAIADLLAHYLKVQSAEFAEIVRAELAKRERNRSVESRHLEDTACRATEMTIREIREKPGHSYSGHCYTAIHNLKKKKGVRWRQPGGLGKTVFFDAESLREVGVRV